jgi:hypothetical protein
MRGVMWCVVTKRRGNGFSHGDPQFSPLELRSPIGYAQFTMNSGPRGAEARVIEMSIGQALAQSGNGLGILLQLLETGKLPSTGGKSVRADPPADAPREGSDRV